MDSLSELASYIVNNPIITLFGIIITIISAIVGFIVSRIWDYFSFKKNIVLEEKKLWSEHLINNIKKLEMLDFDMKVIRHLISNCNKFKYIKERLNNFQLTNYLEISKEANEFVATGYIVKYYELYFPLFQYKLKQDFKNVKAPDELIKSMVELTNITLAYINFLRLRILMSFLDKESIGHTLMHDPLLKIVRDYTGKQDLTPSAAKSLLKNITEYEKINSTIHDLYVESTTKFEKLLEVNYKNNKDTT